jgi:tetratricopeptide (TPR) repeat protein
MLAEGIWQDKPQYVASAQTLFEESLEIRKELADRPGIAECLARLGELEHCRGNYSKAGYLYQQSLDVCRDLGDKAGTSSALINLGHLDLRQGNPGQASVRFRESLVLHKRLNDTRGVIESLAAWAGVAAAFGELAAASRLFGATEALLRSTNFHLYTVDLLEYERNMAAVRARLGEDAWAAGLSEGGRMSREEAFDTALRLHQRNAASTMHANAPESIRKGT